ncbi:MAG: 1-phosphofructokinase [Anaerolineales bacterium]|nr:1-phosphofructokinase [Anaerolineae bacterium]PWB56571.1 MAG: 1-phosphofructokinase [Anaerolineales bacterium]
MIYTITLNPALDRELTVHQIELNRVLRSQSIQIDYGGKGFNVSRALLALGVKSTALGFIGGSVGAQLAAGISSLGIHTDFVHIQGETRTNLSVVDADHRNYLKVNEPGPWVSEVETAALLGKISALASPGDWWILAGSMPPGIQPSFITKIINRIQSVGAYAAVDMEGACLLTACKAGAFLVKPNAYEAAGLTGRDTSTTTRAARTLFKIHDLGTRQAVISLGKAGAVYSDGNRVWWAIPPTIEEHNPIGAGDAMLAGMIYGLSQQLPGEDTLRWGVACGAAAASLDGTAVGTLPLIETLLENVKSGEYLEKGKASQL